MDTKNGLIETIGNTPLIRLRAASEATGCEILGKAEFLNPGGSVKDRAALSIIQDAEKRGTLKPGGVFLIVEHHPFGTIFDDGEAATDLVVGYPYFNSNEPERFDDRYTYTDGDTPLTESAFEWSYTIGEVLNSLISAGLAIDHLHEFPFTGYEALPMMKQGDDGWWRLPEHAESVPLMFSLRATKPA